MLTRRRVVVAIALVLVAGVIALVVSSWVWARSYAPLRVKAYAPAFGVSERPVGENDFTCPTFDGCGSLAFVIHGKTTRLAEFHVVVENDGRWPVTIRPGHLDLYCAHPTNFNNCIELHALRAGPAGAHALTKRPLGTVRVPAHGRTDVWMRLLSRCRKHEPGLYSSGSYALPLVYRYLGVFERTENVQLPFAVDYLC